MNQFPFPIMIEPAFKAMKTNGFNSEVTHTTGGCRLHPCKSYIYNRLTSFCLQPNFSFLKRIQELLVAGKIRLTPIQSVCYKGATCNRYSCYCITVIDFHLHLQSIHIQHDIKLFEFLSCTWHLPILSFPHFHLSINQGLKKIRTSQANCFYCTTARTARLPFDMIPSNPQTLKPSNVQISNE